MLYTNLVCTYHNVMLKLARVILLFTWYAYASLVWDEMAAQPFLHGDAMIIGPGKGGMKDQDPDD